MAVVAVHGAVGLLHGLLQLRLQALVRFDVVRRIAENNLPVAADGDAVLRVGQILRGEPEIKRVLRHQLEGEVGSDCRCTCTQRDRVQLADE